LIFVKTREKVILLIKKLRVNPRYLKKTPSLSKKLKKDVDKGKEMW